MPSKSKRPKVDTSSPWYKKAQEDIKKSIKDAAGKGWLGSRARISYGTKK